MGVFFHIGLLALCRKDEGMRWFFCMNFACMGWRISFSFAVSLFLLGNYCTNCTMNFDFSSDFVYIYSFGGRCVSFLTVMRDV